MRGFLLSLLVSATLVSSAFADDTRHPPDEALFRDIYRQLVEIDTTNTSGSTLQAAEAMRQRLEAAGFPAQDLRVLSPAPRKGNLVARLRGTGQARPLLLLAHLDVVEARREDWAFDPFHLQELDGMFRGRGTIDDKAMGAIFVTNLARMKAEGFVPDRDIILALTTDEELADSPYDGTRWLLETHRDLVDAELAINEGGGGILRDGKPVALNLQLAEKVYRSFRLEVHDAGGHSAQPRRDNAITLLAEALVRLADHKFPARLNPVTAQWLKTVTRLEAPEVRAAVAALAAGDARTETIAPLTRRPAIDNQIRTTCVATQLEGGEAENAMAQMARATVNCRLLPDESPDEVARQLTQVVANPRVAVTPLGSVVESPASPLSPRVMQAVEDLAADFWPGVPVVPTQSGGYTDNRWLRKSGIAAYGISGLFSEEGRNGVHGLNEQIGVQQLFDGKAFLDRLVRRLARNE